MSSPTAAPVTAATSLLTFYDIESLANVFSLCAYTPKPGDPGGAGTLEVFYLVDDADDGSNIGNAITADDGKGLGDAIFASNPGLSAYPATGLRLWNLKAQNAAVRLADIMALPADSYPNGKVPVSDVSHGYDATQHPFLAGYNSMNYDSTMLARFFSEVFPGSHVTPRFQPCTAAAMRQYNDELFSDAYIEYMPGSLGWDTPAGEIRRAMLATGRHLDVARLNEIQLKVSLKRLLGMIGRQIKESDRLSHDTTLTTSEELYGLLAYNVSDCLGLAQLFAHPTYSGNFDLKAGLLQQFAETRFAANGSVRRDRLAVDAKSAKFVARILAPTSPLPDIESVSYNYPHPQVAAERGIDPVNVLQQCVEFFEKTVAPNPATHEVTPDERAAHEAFMQVVNYYRAIEGKNFNDSQEYKDLYPYGVRPVNTIDATTGEQRVHQAEFGHSPELMKEIPKTPNNLPYFTSDAKPSSCFVTFSIGGIHGAEADLNTFAADQLAHIRADNLLLRARAEFCDAVDFVARAKDEHNALALPDGSTVDKRLVLLGSDPAKVKYRKPKKDDTRQVEQLARAQKQVPDPAQLLATQRGADEALDVHLADGTCVPGKLVLANTTAAKAAYRDVPAIAAPVLFKPEKDGNTKLNSKFARTSAGRVIHEDFTSYYPNLLRNMRAFYNPELGEDRYATIFFEKENLGKQMKSPGISAAEKARLQILRNGTKLILNSASGAGDAGHKTTIRMNNQIISMRIIGQLFSWLIGQAQTTAGARIISTNTDGLYSVIGGENGFDEETNNRVLAQQQQAIGVDIEPEPMVLISKDSNNRLELAAPTPGASIADAEILSAGGTQLACYNGPNPTKSLAHPAVIDFALARYLQVAVNQGEHALAMAFEPDRGLKLLQEAIHADDPVSTLMLFQNVIAASRGSITYPFACDPYLAGDDLDELPVRNPKVLQMVNRVFIVKRGTPGSVSLRNAGAWKVTEASINRRMRAGEASRVPANPIAAEILRHHGWARNRVEAHASTGLSLVPEDQDVTIRKITGLDPTWSMQVVNDDLYQLSRQQVTELIEALDLDTYNQILEYTFTRNWRNAS